MGIFRAIGNWPFTSLWPFEVLFKAVTLMQCHICVQLRLLGVSVPARPLNSVCAQVQIGAIVCLWHLWGPWQICEQCSTSLLPWQSSEQSQVRCRFEQQCTCGLCFNYCHGSTVSVVCVDRRNSVPCRSGCYACNPALSKGRSFKYDLHSLLSLFVSDLLLHSCLFHPSLHL